MIDVGTRVRVLLTKETGVVTSISPCGNYYRINGDSLGLSEHKLETIELSKVLELVIRHKVLVVTHIKGMECIEVHSISVLRTTENHYSLNNKYSLTELDYKHLVSLLLEGNRI